MINLPKFYLKIFKFFKNKLYRTKLLVCRINTAFHVLRNNLSKAVLIVQFFSKNNSHATVFCNFKNICQSIFKQFIFARNKF